MNDINVANLRQMSVNSNNDRSIALDLWEDGLLILVRPDNIVAWHMSRANAKKTSFWTWCSDDDFDLKCWVQNHC